MRLFLARVKRRIQAISPILLHLHSPFPFSRYTNSDCFNQIPQFYCYCRFTGLHCNTSSPITLKWVYIVFIIEFNGPVAYFKQLSNDEIIINERLHVGILRTLYKIPTYHPPLRLPLFECMEFEILWPLNFATDTRQIITSEQRSSRSQREHISSSVGKLLMLTYTYCRVGTVNSRNNSVEIPTRCSFVVEIIIPKIFMFVLCISNIKTLLLKSN